MTHVGCHCMVQVKNFGNEHVEAGKFSGAIDSYQGAEYTMVMSFNVVSLLQGTVVFCATTLGFGLCIKVLATVAAFVSLFSIFLTVLARF